MFENVRKIKILMFEVWMQKTMIFDLKFGLYVKFHPYSQFFRTQSPQGIHKIPIFVRGFPKDFFHFFRKQNKRVFLVTRKPIRPIDLWGGVHKIPIFVRDFPKDFFQHCRTTKNMFLSGHGDANRANKCIGGYTRYRFV